MTDTQADRNRETAISFYDLMFNQSRPAEAIEKYAGDEYIQHIRRSHRYLQRHAPLSSRR